MTPRDVACGDVRMTRALPTRSFPMIGVVVTVGGGLPTTSSDANGDASNPGNLCRTKEPRLGAELYRPVGGTG